MVARFANRDYSWRIDKVWVVKFGRYEKQHSYIYHVYIARFLAALFSVSIDGCFEGNTPKRAVHVRQHESDVPLTIRSRDGNNCGGNYGHDWAKKRGGEERTEKGEGRFVVSRTHFVIFASLTVSRVAGHATSLWTRETKR